jgi:hypothetical protein
MTGVYFLYKQEALLSAAILKWYTHTHTHAFTQTWSQYDAIFYLFDMGSIPHTEDDSYGI